MEDSLKWWTHHASEYTVLSEMAFDSFSRPTMSSECKRVSLPTKKVVTAERNHLNSVNVAAIGC